MEIVITEWALDSYLALAGNQAFTDDEYWHAMRPDVLLLKQHPNHPRFSQSKFWSVATDLSGRPIADGFKMKWHNMGSGQNQIRLPVGMFKDALLCQAYVKQHAKQEQRQLAKFKVHLELIRQGRFTERGRLS